MRSTFFFVASLIVHALCISALALGHFRGLESSSGSGNADIEVAMGDGDKGQGEAAIPEVKPLEVEKAPELPAKKPVAVQAKKPTAPAAKAPVKKVATQKAPPTVLPPKETVAETQLPENMNPSIEDAQAVAVPTEQTEEEPKVELIPVKDAVPAGVQAASTQDEAEDKITEAMSTDVSETKDPAPVDQQQEGASGSTTSKGGETKGDAVSYLDLKQFSGNKAPAYPLTARMEQRQGQVDLLYRVTKDGRVAEIQIAKSSGHADLDESAVKAVSKYKYVAGQEGWARHPIVFSIKGAATELPSKLRGSAASAE